MTTKEQRDELQPAETRSYEDGLLRAAEICKTKTWADDCAEAIEQEAKR